MDASTHAAAIRLFLAREQLVETWEERVLADDAMPSARRISLARLRDYVPRFIDVATEALRGTGYRDELRRKAADFARVHVIDRIDEGFTVAEVVRELAHLRSVLLERLVDVPVAQAVVGEALAHAEEITARAFAESAVHARGGAREGDASRTGRGRP